MIVDWMGYVLWLLRLTILTERYAQQLSGHVHLGLHFVSLSPWIGVSRDFRTTLQLFKHLEQDSTMTWLAIVLGQG